MNGFGTKPRKRRKLPTGLKGLKAPKPPKMGKASKSKMGMDGLGAMAGMMTPAGKKQVRMPKITGRVTRKKRKGLVRQIDESDTGFAV